MTFQRDLAWQYLELRNRASVAHQFARYAWNLEKVENVGKIAELMVFAR